MFIRPLEDWVAIGIVTFIFLAICLGVEGCTREAKAEPIDMGAIARIESSGIPFAVNLRNGENAIGLYQVTPILLKEWNNFHPKDSHTSRDLFRVSVNAKIAFWYVQKRIPQMLKHFKKPVTVRNVLIAYNAGIAYVVNGKPLPKITKRYLAKYERITSS